MTHTIAPEPMVGTDGTPRVEDPATTASRMSRLALDLAAQIRRVSADLDATSSGKQRLGDARTVARQAIRFLAEVIDSLGEAHVTCDELAAELHRQVAPTRGAVAVAPTPATAPRPHVAGGDGRRPQGPAPQPGAEGQEK